MSHPDSPLSGIDFSADVDLHTGAAGLRVPLRLSPGRGGFTPSLALLYASGAGNSLAGAGWSLAGLSFIALDTTDGAPSYDGIDPVAYGGRIRIVPERDGGVRRVAHLGGYLVEFFRNKTGQGPRYEKWVHTGTGEVHWRTRNRSDVVTVFGQSPTNRIADPDDPRRVFRWLAESIHDPTGNAVRIEYQAEDGAGVDVADVFEAGRVRRGLFAQRYPKRLSYGNSVPLGPDDPEPAGLVWHFQAVFDYGDHAAEAGPEPDQTWPVRGDPFSSGRAGFELRTYRLLRRVLLFHKFDELGPDPVWVGATRLAHSEHPAGTTLDGIDFEGRREDGGEARTRSVPPLSMTYAEPRVAEEFHTLEPENIENVPAGLTGAYSWVDLYGEGLPGILTETNGTWFYKSNLGDGRFGPQERVGDAPAVAGLPFVFSDFDRDGNPNLGRLLGPEAGYFEYDRNARRWNSFTPFASVPRVGAGAPVQWVDLNADGLPDLVVAHSGHFTWYPSLGKEGFGNPVDVPIPDTQGGAPPIVKQDAALRLFFADMNGDGLPALVRVEPGRVEYWPHFGNGHFGQRVVMEGAPSFDYNGTFDPRRIRFADLDGSGTADLLYLGRGEVRFWTNASGNRYTEGQRRDIPYIDDLAAVQVLDLLGDGTPCLVWSSALPSDAETPVRYLPLTDGVRPRLLLGVDNGMGREVRFQYGTSATHYLRDRAAGRDWVTRLPSHVTVVDRREEVDQVGGGRSVARFEYHDGHFDGHERAFRGFGLVDQYDADEHPGPGDDPDLFLQPTCIRTWFHNGTFDGDRDRADASWEGDPRALRLASSSLESPVEMALDEFEDAYRALVGLTLRQEIYATESGERGARPLQVTQSRYEVRRLQPAADGQPAAFAAHRTERLDADYGGQPDDPRVAHHLSLEVDDHGVIRTEANVAYPRRQPSPAGAEAQQELEAALTRTTVTHEDTPERYRIGVEVESEEFELFGLTPPADEPVDRAALLAALPAALAAPRDVHDEPGPAAGVQLRRSGWDRFFYWSDDRSDVLPLGQVGSPQLVHHEATACLTDALVADIYDGRVDAATLSSAGYVAADGYWWQPGPTYRHRDGSAFFALHQEVSPDGGTTRFVPDASGLYHAEVHDPLGNATVMEHDYQALAPARVTDANGTVTESRYDPLGVAVVTAAHGSTRDADGTDHPHGSDPLAAYADPPPADVGAVLGDPSAFLQQAHGYVFYDLHAWRRHGTPPHVVTLGREELAHDGEGGGTAEGRIQLLIAYGDGFRRTLQQRQRVDPGPAVQRGAGGEVIVDAEGVPVLADAPNRWLVSGHTVYGNKQQPVRQYEPLFSTTPQFEADEVLRRYGVAVENHYDALGALVRTDFPQGTVARTERTPWLERRYDPNDTVPGSPYASARETLPSDDPERQALASALAHADTPVTTHLDALGREILVVEEGAGGAERTTRHRYGRDGRLVEVTDPRGLTAFRYAYDMLGRGLYDSSADAGETWTLFNLDGEPLQLWDGQGIHLTTSYDEVGRPVTLHADGAPGLDQVIERWEYGESLPDAEARARNARGRLIEHRDGAGLLTLHAFTPAGEPLRHSRRLLADYQSEPDWTNPAAVTLEVESFETRTRYDAFGRVVRQVTPDGAVRTHRFQATGHLDRILITTAGNELVDEPILEDATYNARGQRTQATLGNGVQLDTDYDPATFRMRRLRARRFEAAGTRLYQDIAYTYDPVGNVVRVADDAQQPDLPNPHILQGLAVPADATFTYDAFYQLTEAEGRVHQSLLQHDYRREEDVAKPGALKGTRHLSLNNGAAVERYTRRYTYDHGGNLRSMTHTGASRTSSSDYWVSDTSNRRLPATDLNGIAITDPEARFDAAGHCIHLPHLRALDWNSRGRLARAVVIDRSGSGDADDAEYYLYDGGGQRRRKVTERLSHGRMEVIDRLYLDGCVIKRIRHGDTPILERHSSEVDDGVNRLAIVHRWVRDDRARETDDPGAVRVHYQLHNHLGSTALELDSDGGVISYEEYFPYGGSAFLAGASARDVRIKDYRYSGKERDDETGFYYYGYRYYAPFIGGWLSPDPLGPADGLNLYRFVRNNPVSLTDPNGLQSVIKVEGELPAITFDPEAREAYERTVESMVISIGEKHYTLDVRVEPIHDEEGNFVRWWAEEISRTEVQVESIEFNDEDVEEIRVGSGGGAEEADEQAPGPGGRDAEQQETGDGGGEEAKGGDGTGDGSGAGADDATDTPGDGDAGSSPDADDPSADASHDATGGSNPASGGGPRDATGNGPGAGEKGTGQGAGGEDPKGTGTGNEGTGTGGGTGTGSGTGQQSGGDGGSGQHGGDTGTTGGGRQQGSNGPGGGGGAPDATNQDSGGPPTREAPGGYDPDGSTDGREGPPPDGYRPPPPGTLPGGTSLTGSPTGTIGGGPDGSEGDPNGTSGEGGQPGSGQGGGGQGGQQDGEQGAPPAQRESDALDTLVDVASYITLDAFFDDDAEGGDPNGVPGGLGLFDLNLGRWGQVAYVGAALFDLVATVLTLGEYKALMVGAKQALKRGLAQLRRLAPLAKQAIKQAGEEVARFATRQAKRSLDAIRRRVENLAALGAKAKRALDPRRLLPRARTAARSTSQAVEEAFHYTDTKWLDSMMEGGLRPSTFATPEGGLSPLQAQLDLALPPNRPLPNAVVRIDVSGLRSAGYEIPQVSRVSSAVPGAGGRVYTMPGGGTEMQFPYAIPPEFLKVMP